MNRTAILLVLVLLLSPSLALTVNWCPQYDEPAGDTDVFLSTSVWSYERYNTSVCTCEPDGPWLRRVRVPNLNGATAASITTEACHILPLHQNRMPTCVCWTVTVEDDEKNETAPGAVLPAAGPKVFTEAAP